MRICIVSFQDRRCPSLSIDRLSSKPKWIPRKYAGAIFHNRITAALCEGFKLVSMVCGG